MGECRIVVLGTGQPLRRDDSAGIVVARRLRDLGYECVYECPGGVELCTHHVSEHRPELVVIVDAALGISPGEAVLLEEAPGTWISTTHALRPELLERYIKKTTGSKILYLAIGVVDTGLGEGLSEEALRGVERALKIIVGLLEGGKY